LERLEQEHDNLRVALEWALKDVADEQAIERRDLALRLSAVLWGFWEERVRLMRQVGEPGDVADALYSLAEVVGRRGEIARGEVLFQEALLLYRKAGNGLGVAATLIQSAIALWWLSLADAATIQTIRHRLQEAQTIVTRLGSRHWMGLYSWLAALVALSEGEIARADRLAQESLAIFREIGNRWLIAWGLHTRGRIEAQRGEMIAAHRPLPLPGLMEAP
jgi:hypothetical protein